MAWPVLIHFSIRNVFKQKSILVVSPVFYWQREKWVSQKAMCKLGWCDAARILAYMSDIVEGRAPLHETYAMVASSVAYLTI